jgi:hypothetical protein
VLAKRHYRGCERPGNYRLDLPIHAVFAQHPKIAGQFGDRPVRVDLDRLGAPFTGDL